MPMYAVPPQRGELTILTGEVSGYRGKSMVVVSDQYGEWLVQQPSSIEDAFIPPSSSSLLRAGDIVRVRGYMDDERYYHQGSL